MAKRSVLDVVIPEAISNPGSGVGQAVGEMTLEGRGGPAWSYHLETIISLGTDFKAKRLEEIIRGNECE